MKKKKLFFKECHLAGRQYHDANEVWEELKVGTLLELQRDQENPYDKNAVAVVYSKVADNNEKGGISAGLSSSHFQYRDCPIIGNGVGIYL